jgi:hypothetical protein
MKRAVLFLAAGGILAAVTLCGAAASPGASEDSSDIEQLKKEIATLRERVESLERRLNEQTLTIPRGRVMPPMTVDPNSLPGFRSTPRDWKRFDFNGQPVYVIPIDNASPATSRPEPDRKK